jgi:hypothetical protein
VKSGSTKRSGFDSSFQVLGGFNLELHLRLVLEGAKDEAQGLQVSFPWNDKIGSLVTA